MFNQSGLIPSCTELSLLFLAVLFGASKCGVNLVRYPYCKGDPIVGCIAGMDESGRSVHKDQCLSCRVVDSKDLLEKFLYALTTTSCFKSSCVSYESIYHGARQQARSCKKYFVWLAWYWHPPHEPKYLHFTLLGSLSLGLGVMTSSRSAKECILALR